MATDDNVKKDIGIAIEQFEQFEEGWREFRTQFDEDQAFRSGEQWPDRLKQARENSPGGARPCLVLDKVNQFIRQVANTARQNPIAIKISASDYAASDDAAKTLAQYVRYLEHISDASSAYDHAFDAAVSGGLGWFRVLPIVVDEATNAQEPRIRRIPNHLSVVSDVDWVQPDGSDIYSLFITEDMPVKVFEGRYPKHETSAFVSSAQHRSSWLTRDTVRIAEHFLVSHQDVTMLAVKGGKLLRENDYLQMYKDEERRPEVTGSRMKREKVVLWRKMTSVEVLENSTILCSHVPVIPMIGTEIWKRGKRNLYGMVHDAADGQRLYNYGRSAHAESVSLAPKVPFLAVAGQLEGYEQEWRRAQTENLPFLYYKNVDEGGNPLPAPQRQPSPMGASGWSQDMQFSENDIQSSLGMYQASIGASSNERSGRAINARNAQADTGSFHYMDNRKKSVLHCGKIVVEMIRRTSDIKRTIKTMSEDGKITRAIADPSLEAPHTVVPVGQERRTMVNFNIGEYEVTVDVGPSYASMQEEAAVSMEEMAKNDPTIKQVAGDLIVKAQGWPMADQIAKRLRTLLPPAVVEAELAEEQGRNVDPALLGTIQQLKGQIQEMQKDYEKMQYENLRGQLLLKNRDEANEIAAHEAETARIAALANVMTPEMVAQVVVKTVSEILGARSLSEGSESSEVPSGNPMPVPSAPGNADASQMGFPQ
jgi:hypothetical protein